MTYRLWVNAERTVLVRLWENGKVEVATRSATWESWGPPVYCEEEDLLLTMRDAAAAAPE